MRLLTPAYRGLLTACLAFPLPVYAIALAGLVATGVAYVSIGKSFMPTMDEGAVIVQTTKLPSINLERSAEVDQIIQRTLLDKVPEVQRVISRVGADELGLDPMGLNETDAFLVLKPKEQWRVHDKEWLLVELRKALGELPGLEFAYTQPIEMRTSEMLSGARGDLAVKIFGPDLKVLSDLAGRIKAVLAGVPGATEVMTLANETVDYLRVDVDRIATGRTRLTTTRVQDEMRAMLEGVPAGQVVEAQRRTPIIVRGPQDVRAATDLFARSQLAAGDGGLVRITDVAKVTRQDGVVKIDRENASRFGLVQAFVSGRDLVGYVEEAQRTVAAKVQLPSGYRLVWGGQFENQRRAALRLAIVVPVALALIFVILFATLRSMRQALLIIANVPFALTGGILALWASGEYLSVPASVGFIALLGIAVLNGLVLVSYFNQLVAQGMRVEQAVVDGAVRRLRPVLMTASIAAFGLVPLLFASGPGSEIQRPLAIVVIGGLASSTALTLVLLPILFRRFGLEGGVAQSQDRSLAWTNPFAS